MRRRRWSTRRVAGRRVASVPTGGPPAGHDGLVGIGVATFGGEEHCHFA